jgi:hypothetical protein
MILGMEIALLCAGLYALATGRFTVTRNRVVHGAPARFLGFLALLPFPLCIGYGFLRGADMAARGQDPSQLASDWNMIAVEAGVVILSAIVVFGLGAVLAEPVQSRSRSHDLSDDERFRRAHPERFGGPVIDTAYQQGATKLRTAALFEQRAARPPDVALRPPERGRAPLSGCMVFILIAFLLGIVTVAIQQSGISLFPPAAPEEQALGDPNTAWKHLEVADPPPQLPGLDPRLQQPGARVYLSDLPEFAFKPGSPGWGFGKAGALGTPGFPNQRVRFLDKAIDKSLCLHPHDVGYTRVCYRLGQRAQALHVEVCVSDHDPRVKPSPSRFVVMGDGKVIWRSTSVRGYGYAGWIKLDVHFVDVLELRVYAEEGLGLAHAVWLNPYVEVRK